MEDQLTEEEFRANILEAVDEFYKDLAEESKKVMNDALSEVVANRHLFTVEEGTQLIGQVIRTCLKAALVGMDAAIASLPDFRSN